MKRLTLAIALLAVGFYGASMSSTYNQATVVHADTCKVQGKQVATGEGVLVCDCTQTQNTNCQCLLECPRPPMQ